MHQNLSINIGQLFKAIKEKITSLDMLNKKKCECTYRVLWTICSQYNMCSSFIHFQLSDLIANNLYENKTWGHMSLAFPSFADALEYIRLCKLQCRKLWLQYCVNIFLLFLNKRFSSFRFPTLIYSYTRVNIIRLCTHWHFVVKYYHYYRYIVV